jgi:hypothetical protein
MTRIGGLGVTLMVAAWAGGTASAQYVSPNGYPYAYPYHVVPHQRTDALAPDEILAIVRSMNFVPVARPVWTGPLYIVRATNRRGEVMRVVLDARSGALISVRRASPLRAYFYTYAYRYDRYRRFGWLEDEEDLLLPPPGPLPHAERRSDRPPIPPPVHRQDPSEGARSMGTASQRTSYPQVPTSERRTALLPGQPPLPRPRPAAANLAAVPPTPAAEAAPRVDRTDPATTTAAPSGATASQEPPAPGTEGVKSVAKTAVESVPRGSTPPPAARAAQDPPDHDRSFPPMQSFE